MDEGAPMVADASRSADQMSDAGALPATDDGDPAGLRSLAGLTNEALRTEWCRLYRVPPPPRVRRELLLLGVACKRQELVLGGLGAVAQRRLVVLADRADRSGDAGRSREVRLKPGVRLLCQWRGETHSVLVLEDGFAWRGQRWRSLSEIAGAITGAHWSGPRFFGLNGAKQGKDKGACRAQVQ